MDWNVGDFCVAKSSKFEDLYNAKILEFLPNDSKAKVSFIEYGDIEEVLLSDLKRFEDFSINKAGDLVRGEQRSSEVGWPGGGRSGMTVWPGGTGTKRGTMPRYSRFLVRRKSLCTSLNTEMQTSLPSKISKN